MPVAAAQILTPRAQRFLVQLCRHAEAMSGKAGDLHGPAGQARPEVVEVEYADGQGRIRFTWGDCVLQSTSDTLTVRVDAGDPDQLTRIQGILAADLERFGRRDGLEVSWQGTSAADDAGHEKTGRVRRPRATTIALVVAVALAIAAHVVVGTAALAAWRWTSVAADILLALVILKIVVVALFARRRWRGHGIGLAAHFSRRKRRTHEMSTKQVVTAETSIPTERAEHYAKQLCSHAAGRTSRAEWTPQQGVIEFPGGTGTCRLTADPAHLKIVIEAKNPAILAEMEEIVGGLVAQFAGREQPAVRWTPS